MNGKGNVFGSLPTERTQEMIEVLLNSPKVRIERIVSRGHTSPPDFWYEQDEREWVLLLEGAARLQFEAELIALEPGDYLDIPAGKRHRVDWTSHETATIWLAIFYRD